MRAGDSLWVIARRRGVSVEDLRAWNGPDLNDRLMPGQILKLEGRAAPSNSTAAPGSTYRSYVVRNGDSLWLIARRHSISTEQLASWNELSINGVLQPGQTLQVAPPAPDTGDAPSTNSL